LGATLGGVAGVVVVSVLLALWVRHRRHNQRVGLENQARSGPNVVAMETNPLHAGTGTRVWDPASYDIHGSKISTKNWDSSLYATNEPKGSVATREWDPTLYAVRADAQPASSVPRYEECTTYDEDDADVDASASQRSSRHWDPSFYAVGKDNRPASTRSWDPDKYEVGEQQRLGQSKV